MIAFIQRNLYYSLRSKSITRSVSVYITKADCKGHMCSVSSMNRNVLIFNTLGREPHALCPTTLEQVLCLHRNPNSLLSQTVHAMCWLTS